MTKPLVSVVVPSYNHCLFITQCIESIVNQDYGNFEIIVIDDGSTDDSYNILVELKKKYNFYLEFNANQGSSKTLTRGFRDIAKGKYFTFCSSDDYWLPGKLSKQVRYLEENPEYAMVFGNSIVIDEFEKIDINRTNSQNSNLKGGWIFRELINIQFHPPGNGMIKAEVMRDLGYYKGDVWAEDFDMILKIGNKHPIGFINEPLSVYRINNSMPSKILNFRTIYSHKDSILNYKDNIYFSEAMKNWNMRCFTWFAPFTKGKLLAINGMFNSLDKIFTRPFLISFLVLIFKWKK